MKGIHGLCTIFLPRSLLLHMNSQMSLVYCCKKTRNWLARSFLNCSMCLVKNITLYPKSFTSWYFIQSVMLGCLVRKCGGESPNCILNSLLKRQLIWNCSMRNSKEGRELLIMLYKSSSNLL